MDKMLFIYNPNAGKGTTRKNLSHLLELFSQVGYEITVFPTSKKGDARAIAQKKARKFDLIVCSGGDGTLNEVADGLMRYQEKMPNGARLPELGYIPAGTVNDFASSLQIPKDIEKAIAIITGGKLFACDIGSMENKEGKLFGHFTYIAGFGAFTEVSYETPQNIKNVLGKAAYFMDGVRRLPNLRPYEMKVSFEEQTIEDKFLFGMVTNSKSVGGFKGITGKEVYLDDGRFDVMLIKPPKNPIDLQNIINSLLTKELNTPNIYHFHVPHIQFECTEAIPWVLDGESGGVHRTVVIKNHHQALKVRVAKEQIEG